MHFAYFFFLTLACALAQFSCPQIESSVVYVGTGINLVMGDSPIYPSIVMIVELWLDEPTGPQYYCNLGNYTFGNLTSPGIVYFFFPPSAVSCSPFYPLEERSVELRIYAAGEPEYACWSNSFKLSAIPVPIEFVSPTPHQGFIIGSKIFLQAYSSYPMYLFTPMFCFLGDLATNTSYPTPVTTWRDITSGIAFPVPNGAVPSTDYVLYCGFNYAPSQSFNSPKFSIVSTNKLNWPPILLNKDWTLPLQFNCEKIMCCESLQWFKQNLIYSHPLGRNTGWKDKTKMVFFGSRNLFTRNHFPFDWQLIQQRIENQLVRLLPKRSRVQIQERSFKFPYLARSWSRALQNFFVGFGFWQRKYQNKPKDWMTRTCLVTLFFFTCYVLGILSCFWEQ